MIWPIVCLTEFFLEKHLLNKSFQQNFSKITPGEKHDKRDMASKFYGDWMSGSRLLVGTKWNINRFSCSLTLTQGHQDGGKKFFPHAYVNDVVWDELLQGFSWKFERSMHSQWWRHQRTKNNKCPSYRVWFVTYPQGFHRFKFFYNIPMFYIAAIFEKYCYTNGSWLFWLMSQCTLFGMLTARGKWLWNRTIINTLRLEQNGHQISDSMRFPEGRCLNLYWNSIIFFPKGTNDNYSSLV